jgi:hypothetical protein
MLPKKDNDDVEEPTRPTEDVVEHQLEGVDDAGDDADVGGLRRRQDAEGRERVDRKDRRTRQDDHLGDVAPGVLDRAAGRAHQLEAHIRVDDDRQERQSVGIPFRDPLGERE